MTASYDINDQEKNTAHDPTFDLDAELTQYHWIPDPLSIHAEKSLEGKSAYTYLLRPREEGRGFAISFMQPTGYVKHDHFSLIDAERGIFRNGQGHHVGKLAKVIDDMLYDR